MSPPPSTRAVRCGSTVRTRRGRAGSAHGHPVPLGLPLNHIGIGLQERIVLNGLLGGRPHGVLAVEVPGPTLEDGSQRLGNTETGKSRGDVCPR